MIGWGKRIEPVPLKVSHSEQKPENSLTLKWLGSVVRCLARLISGLVFESRRRIKMDSNELNLATNGAIVVTLVIF